MHFQHLSTSPGSQLVHGGFLGLKIASACTVGMVLDTEALRLLDVFCQCVANHRSLI